MSTYCDYSDQDLLLFLSKGDRIAFTEIYDRHWEKMASYAIRLTRSEDEGADIVQEVFVSIWNRKEVLNVQGTLIAYLIKSTRNLCLKYIERNLRQHHFLERFSQSMKDALPQFEDKLSLKQLEDNVEAAIDKLPRKMKEVYQLSRTEQLSHREIAQRLGIAETTVKKQISNALKIISESLNKEYSAIAGFVFIHFLK